MPQVHRTYKFDKLIKVADDELLREYFSRKGFVIPPDQPVTPEYIHELMDKIADEETALDLEEELLCINDIADTSVDRLDEIIEEFNIECDEDESPETTALRIYLHDNDEAFERAYDFYLCDVHSERLNHYPVACEKFEFSEEKIEQFQQKMQSFLKETRNTDNCYIRHRMYQGKFYVLIARGEPKKTLMELDGKRLKPRVYRPAKEDVLVYNQEASVLSLSSGRRKQIETVTYIETFAQNILGVEISENIFSSESRLVDLSLIIDDKFYQRTEDIAEIKLRQLYVKHHAEYVTEIIFKSDDVMKSIAEMSFPIKNCKLLSAKLDFYIEGRKRHIPVHLTSRGNTEIKQRREKEILEGFLRERGVLKINQADKLHLATA